MVARGDLHWADFREPMGSEPGYRRPCVVIQNDRFNRAALSTCVVASLTTNMAVAGLPGNVFIPAEAGGLDRDSVVNVTQLATLDVSSLGDQIGTLPTYLMADISAGLRLVLDL